MMTQNQRCLVFLGALLGSTFLFGCASTPSTTSPSTPDDHHHGEPSIDAGKNPAEPFRPLAIPPANESGDNVQVTRLLDEPHATILSIRLRHGAEFPTHNAPVPVIIQAASGSGTVILGNDRVPIGNGRFVTLAPKIKHSVLPDSDADLVLLVTQLRGGGSK